MPIHKEGSGFQWGNHGKVYPTKEGAVKQAQAAHASGYKSKEGALVEYMNKKKRKVKK